MTASSLSGRSLLLLLVLVDLGSCLVALTLSLMDKVGNRLFEVINTVAHLVNAINNVVAHGLETGLHLSEHLLDELGELVGRIVSAWGSTP
jgi:hypothetical protein